MRKITSFVIVSVLAGAFWIFRPYQSYDKDKVHPSIISLVKPYKRVGTSYWMDGGSVTIFIEDSRGTQFFGCIPEPDHQRLFVGAEHYLDATAVEVKNSTNSIAYLLSVVRSSPQPSRANDSSVARASGRLRDWLVVAWRGITKRYQSMPPETE